MSTFIRTSPNRASGIPDSGFSELTSHAVKKCVSLTAALPTPSVGAIYSTVSETGELFRVATWILVRAMQDMQLCRLFPGLRQRGVRGHPVPCFEFVGAQLDLLGSVVPL